MKTYLSFINEDKDSFKEEMMKFMNSLLEGSHLQLGSQKYPHFLFFVKDNETIMHQHTENGDLWVSWSKVWQFLQSKFKLNYNEVQEFIRRYVALKYNLKGVTFEAVLKITSAVALKYNLKGVTPSTTSTIIGRALHLDTI